jgi:hypothetical protein
MNLYKEYKDILRNATYYKDFFKKIYLIFEGKGGIQVLNNDLLPKSYKIKDLLILNNEINQGLSYVHSQIHNLITNQAQMASYLYYFSQYGGSKTQFLEMVKSDINYEFPNVISVLFEDLTQINAPNIFNRMLAQIFRKVSLLPEFEENPAKYREFFGGLNDKVAKIQVALNQSRNLSKAEDLINELSKTKNIHTKQLLEKLNTLLHTTILMDSEEILEYIIQLMQYCTQNGFIFLFLFDEVDLWLDENSSDLRFSDSFLKKTKFMKSILEIPDQNVRMFYLFACTDRINQLFKTQHASFSTRSPAASRLIRIYDNAEKILEPGSYGDAIESALVKIAAYHKIYYDKEVDSTFFDKTIAPLSEKYKSLSRRNCNSKIIQLLRHYMVVYPSLQNGMKSWEKNVQKYGHLIEDNFQSIMKRLNIKFVRENLLIDPSQQNTRNKIDGYFINYDFHEHEIKTYVEIKVTKNFKGDKAYQALQWIQMNPTKPIVMIIFSQESLTNIKSQIIEFAEKENFGLDLVNKINFIHINNPYAFCAINGIENVNSDPKATMDFFNAFAPWLDFYGEFTKKYQELKEKLGIDTFIIPSRPVNMVYQATNPLLSTEITNSGVNPTNANVSLSGNRIPSPTSIQNSAAAPVSNLNGPQNQNPSIELTGQARITATLFAHMYKARSFTKSGRIYKTKIQTLIENKSMGISDLENLLEFMKKKDIILKITPKTVSVPPEFFEISSIDDLLQKINSFLTRTSKGDVLLGFL